MGQMLTSVLACLERISSALQVNWKTFPHNTFPPTRTLTNAQGLKWCLLQVSNEKSITVYIVTTGKIELNDSKKKDF